MRRFSQCHNSESINFPLLSSKKQKHYRSKMQEYKLTVRKILPVSEGTTMERKEKQQKLSSKKVKD